MKKGFWRNFLSAGAAAFICLMCLAGCGNEPEELAGGAGLAGQGGDSASEMQEGKSGWQEGQRQEDGQRQEGQQTEQPGDGAVGSRGAGKAFDSSLFSGRIESVHYAGGGRLLVYADSLYLYDLAEGKILGEYVLTEGRFQIWSFCAFPDGYALLGTLKQEKGEDGGQQSLQMTTSTEDVGLRCWLFDGDLALRECLDLHALLKKEGENLEFSARFSQDGEWIVIAGLRGLYLYQVEKNTFLRLLAPDSQCDNLKNISVTEAYFTGQGRIQNGFGPTLGETEADRDGRGEAAAPSGLIFTGIAIPEGKQNSVPIYGTVKLDGSGLKCHTVSDYVLSGDMIAYEGEVWLPENFQEATGRVLVIDAEGQTLRVVELEGEDTGKDGLSGSEQGAYVVTLADANPMGAWQGWRLRIYEAAGGKLVCERNVGTDTDAYSGLSCNVKILDGRRECIVICGRDRKTQISSFFF